MTKKVIIDTDPGVDDLAAIYLAIASKELDILAVTSVHGNIELEKTTHNALALLDYIQADIPVYRGANKPLAREPIFAKEIHGKTGLGGVELPEPTSKVKQETAAQKIIELCHRHPNEITIIALGPPTNIALALALDPSIEDKIEKIVFMGGAVRTKGNVSPVATFNIYCDPEATSRMYKSSVPVVQVGLDVCSKVRVSNENLEQMKESGTKPGIIINDAAKFRREAYIKAMQSTKDETGVFFNDLPAVAYVLWPECFKEEEAFVTIETNGTLTLGQTVTEFTGQWGHSESNTIILMDVDGEQVANNFAQTLSEFK